MFGWIKRLFVGRNKSSEDTIRRLVDKDGERWILTSQKINDNDAKVLAEELKVNKTLSYLHIGDNKIGNEGAKALAEALKVNKTLSNLDIGPNENVSYTDMTMPTKA